MTTRYLFGPVTSTFAQQHLQAARSSGQCLAFNASGDLDQGIRQCERWEDLVLRLPQGQQPDFIALYLPYTSIPQCLWSAPVPIIGLAPDWNLLWHYYR